MREIGMREFRANLAKELGELPFRVVRRGVVVCEVVPPTGDKGVVEEYTRPIKSFSKDVQLRKGGGR